jgi:hypothetical protein
MGMCFSVNRRDNSGPTTPPAGIEQAAAAERVDGACARQVDPARRAKD